VLSRQPALTAQDDATIRAKLQSLGFDLVQVQAHRHGAP
jgi:lipocalin